MIERPRMIVARSKELARLDSIHSRHRVAQCLHRDEPDTDAPFDITAVAADAADRPHHYSFG